MLRSRAVSDQPPDDATRSASDPIPAPIHNEIDLLVDAMSRGAHAPSASPTTRPARRWRLVLASAVVFVLAVAFLMRGLRLLTPDAADNEVSRDRTVVRSLDLSLPSRPLPSWSVETPQGTTGAAIAAAATPDAPALPVDRGGLADTIPPPPVAAPDATASITLTTPPVPSAVPINPETPAFPREAPPTVPDVARGRVVEAPAGARDADAVRRVLDEYVDAYRSLDVAAAAAVWPSVDRRALSRAFSTLKSQDVEFERCEVKAAVADAEVRCRGRLRFVRKVGSPTPRIEPQEWVFRMQKFGTVWKIEQITAVPARIGS
jgi:hypothetical protein